MVENNEAPHLFCQFCKIERTLTKTADVDAKVYICSKCGSMGIEGYKTPVLHYDFDFDKWFVVERGDYDALKDVLSNKKEKAVEEFKKKNMLP